MSFYKEDINEDIKKNGENEIDDNQSCNSDMTSITDIPSKSNGSINITIKESNEKDKKLLSDMLAFLDGYNNHNDNIIIMTTNHVDKLDPAITRYGRVDQHLILKYPDVDQQKRLCDLYRIDHIKNPSLIDDNYQKSVTSYIHTITNTENGLI